MPDKPVIITLPKNPTNVSAIQTGTRSNSRAKSATTPMVPMAVGLTRRVHHGDESEKRQVVLDGLDFNMFGLMGDLAHGHRHHTVGLLGERPALAKDAFPFVRRHSNGFAMDQ